MNSENAHIAVILCTYNGENFIKEQIDSILNQSYQNFTIYISDDGSSDKTLDIVYQYKKFLESEKIKITNGPKLGYGNNFISNLKKHIDEANYFCYCDQDDIWDIKKIEHALTILINYENEPALYCSVTNIISEDGDFIGKSHYKNITPSFGNALCQSIAGGNTMVFNKKAALLLNHIPNKMQISSHDWITYLIISAAGGIIYYDRESYISYRQHNKNLVGNNQKLKSKIIRFLAFYNGSYRKWNGQNIDILDSLPCILNFNKKLFFMYKEIHYGNFFSRLIALSKISIYRNSILETYIFYLGGIFKLI